VLRNRLLAAVLRHDDPARAATDPGRLTSLAETDVMRVSSFVVVGRMAAIEPSER
jgi:hypothetical protein